MNLSFIVVPTLIKILLINSVERIIHTNGAAGNFFFKKVYSVYPNRINDKINPAIAPGEEKVWAGICQG